MLNALAFLGPEEITKELLDALINTVSCDLTELEHKESSNTVPGVVTAVKTSALAVAALLIVGSAIVTLSKAGSFEPSTALSSKYQRLIFASAVGIGGFYAMSGFETGDERNGVITKLDQSDKPINSPALMDVDEVWSTLKMFSLLTMRQKNCASMHRLLQSLLRTRQSPKAQKSSIESCLSAISKMWSFDPAETNTWAKAGKELEHVVLIGDHCCSSHGVLNFSLNVRLTAITLLCEAALYMSMVLSQFKTAKHLLVKTCKWLKSFSMKSTKRLRMRWPELSLTLGKVERYCGNFENADKNFKFALINAHEEWDMAAIYHEMGVLSIKLDQFASAEIYLNKSLTIKRRLRVEDSTPLASNLKRVRRARQVFVNGSPF